MLSYSDEIVIAAEEIAQAGDIDEVLEKLRQLCLDDFAELLLELPDPRFPHLSSVLPRMASEEVQKNWTGNSGMALLSQTLSFVRLTVLNYQSLRGHGIENRAILDFGCGYGRIIRLLYYFTSPTNIWGVDPRQESLDICRADGVRAHFAISDYLPTTLPLENTNFDLMYSFSVFTHLSPRAATQALRTLRRYVAKDGLLVITIRPIEYWHVPDTAGGDPQERARLLKEHQSNGFAFFPHQLVAAVVDGETTYGDASISLGWLKKCAEDWDLVKYDRSLVDPLQIHAYLVPK